MFLLRSSPRSVCCRGSPPDVESKAKAPLTAPATVINKEKMVQEGKPSLSNFKKKQTPLDKLLDASGDVGRHMRRQFASRPTSFTAIDKMVQGGMLNLLI